MEYLDDSLKTAIFYDKMKHILIELRNENGQI